MQQKKLTKPVIADPDYPVAETKYGKVRGMLREDVFIFRGIDYAKSRRFHLPEEPDAWEGIKPALAYGPVPDELSTRIRRQSVFAQRIGSGAWGMKYWQNINRYIQKMISRTWSIWSRKSARP